MVQTPTTKTNEFLTDAQDLLGSPDLAGQLDIWSNLVFSTDEPVISQSSDDNTETHKRKREEDDDESEDGDPTPSAKRLSIDALTAPSSTSALLQQIPHTLLPTQFFDQDSLGQPGFDLPNFLRGLGVDPFMVPPSGPHTLSPSGLPLTFSQTPFTPTSSSAPTPASASASTTAAKRSRAPRAKADASEPDVLDTAAVAEDKRRRNTAASARFRLKKKEREAALEKKSKELEDRLTQLERECEALRKENGWLKGLVVGVTNEAAAATAAASNLGMGSLEDVALDRELPKTWSRPLGEISKGG